MAVLNDDHCAAGLLVGVLPRGQRVERGVVEEVDE
jgi:hypothetical protein